MLKDHAYDTNAGDGKQIEGKGAVLNALSKLTRRCKSFFSPVLYRGRSANGRVFYRLKEFRWSATRYDKLTADLLRAVHLAATARY